ncbi:nitrate- and nitrite sensing domain-containing protein [Nocardia sp. NBC_01388]|uniref:sensor histidine kinase n=1 Tax=Nocardia sp. NBC_01388 TaxID=2903596 RepID=UPI0032531B4F
MNLRPARLLSRGSVWLTPALEFARPRTIRARLRRILIVSVALVLALLTVIIAGEIGRYRDTGATTNAVDLALGVQDLVHEVQRERGLTNGLLGGDGSARNAVNAERTAVDAALQALNNVLDKGAPGSDQVHSALAQFSGVSANRAGVDARHIDRPTSFNFYTNAILALNQARPGLANAQDSALWRGLQTLYALGDVKEFTAQERGFLNGVFTAGEFGAGEYVQFLNIRAGKLAAISAFQRDATSGQQAQLDAVMRSDDAVQAAGAESVAIGSERGLLQEPISASDWWRQMTSVIDAQRVVQRSVGSDIHARAAELRREATLVLGAYALAALLATAAMVSLVVATVRAIVRPLTQLAEEADAVATQRLPQLIAAWSDSSTTDPDPPEPVRADERAGTEIASVATALDRVQATAFELASAQARLRRNTTESLANLARRNQNLVRRQLGLISEFEREELDPNALSNLFELDHLATRMRRNAESLLVLVGESSPRRWAQSIPLSDVIRAGLSEVDDYRRVVLRRVDDAAIAGAAVSELAHMLAELIENGLAFSPPDLEIEIYGRRLGPRYLIAIVDHGVGMPPDQLAIANARLRGEADFLVAPTRFLGHFVVGRLAQRLGIEVELTVSPVSGVVARLFLPEALLGDQPQPVLPELPAAEPKHAATVELPVSGGMAGYSTGRHRPLPAVPQNPAPDHELAFGTGEFGPATDSGIASHIALSAGGPGRGYPNGAPVESDTVRLIPLRESADSAGRQEPVAPTAPEPEPEIAGTVPEVQRTRNGLVKRSRKTRENSGATPGGAQPAPTAPVTAPHADRSPEQVRSILSGFRAGHQRGELGAPPQPGSNP